MQIEPLFDIVAKPSCRVRQIHPQVKDEHSRIVGHVTNIYSLQDGIRGQPESVEA